jgi:hypothetical protein
MKLELPQPTVDPRGNMKFPVFNPETGKVEKPEIPARRTFYRDIAVLALPATGIAGMDQVKDLTGKSEWEVPAGQWTIYRLRVQGYCAKPRKVTHFAESLRQWQNAADPLPGSGTAALLFHDASDKVAWCYRNQSSVWAGNFAAQNSREVVAKTKDPIPQPSHSG